MKQAEEPKRLGGARPGAGRPRKLSPEQVKEAKRLHWRLALSQKEVAKRLGVSQGTISKVVR